MVSFADWLGRAESFSCRPGSLYFRLIIRPQQNFLKSGAPGCFRIIHVYYSPLLSMACCCINVEQEGKADEHVSPHPFYAIAVGVAYTSSMRSTKDALLQSGLLDGLSDPLARTAKVVLQTAV